MALVLERSDGRGSFKFAKKKRLESGCGNVRNSGTFGCGGRNIFPKFSVELTQRRVVQGLLKRIGEEPQRRGGGVRNSWGGKER